ncbi:zonular occludens toxin domain-containing protein, partial [Kibdelosporangium lantanae]
ATTGCPSGDVQTRLRLGQFDEAVKAAGEWQDIYGKDNFYVELMNHGIDIELKVRSELLELAKKLNIPTVVTNDSHYTFAHEREAHDALLCVQTGKTLQDPTRFKFDGEGYYLKSPDEMRAVDSSEAWQEGCRNTLLIAEKVDVSGMFEFRNLMPRFPIPEGLTEDEYFKQRVWEGMNRRFPDGVDDVHKKQVEFEIGVILQMGFPAYFLVVADFINWAKENGIRVGPGRGSAAGALIAYAMGITDLDPLAHGLIFERFLNPDRVSPPDIDIDFDERRRGDVIRYVTEKWGEDKVAQVITFGTIKAKAAIKDGWPHRDTDHAWVRPPMPAGKGWGAQIRLPMGASVNAIQRAKTTLAHNLGCLAAELFLDPSEDDPTVLDLFRLDRGVLREPVPEYPLLHEGTTDFWAGFPIGVSPRGAEVTGAVNERNYVVSGIMGSGKTTLIVGLLLGAVLDPLVDIDVFVFAENADYDALKPCLNTFSAGDTPENVEACLDHIAGLHAELSERGKLLQKHGITSVTREAAAKEPGLRPRIVVIDECQSFFRQDTPEKRRQVVNMVVRFFSAARKYGITCVFATPVPSDQSLPRDLVSVASNRACFAIGDKTRNNVVLGDKAHENGVSALGLKPKTKDKLNDAGTFIGINFMDTPGTVRTYYTTPQEQAEVVQRALELRGGAAAQQAAPEERDALADVLTVAQQVQPREGEQHPRA